MARTYRNIKQSGWHRKPRYKWKLLDGVSRKHVVDDWADKPIAARREMKSVERGYSERFPWGKRVLVK